MGVIIPDQLQIEIVLNTTAIGKLDQSNSSINLVTGHNIYNCKHVSITVETD